MEKQRIEMLLERAVGGAEEGVGGVAGVAGVAGGAGGAGGAGARAVGDSIDNNCDIPGGTGGGWIPSFEIRIASLTLYPSFRRRL